jgi:hypothetical protein
VVLLTYEMVDENGNPPSRAKDHNCLDDAATVLITLEVSVMMTMDTMMSAPTKLLVVL